MRGERVLLCKNSKTFVLACSPRNNFTVSLQSSRIKLGIRARRTCGLAMAPKKNDDKAIELAQRDDERFVVMEGELSTMKEQMGELMKMMASGFEKLALRKVDPTGEKDRRVGGPITPDLISNPADALKPTVYQGEGSGKSIMEEPRSVSGGRFVAESGQETSSAATLYRQKTAMEEREDSLAQKIEIPLFDGDGVESWVLRVEQYFEMFDFTEEEKLRAVRMCYTGEALPWYRWERNRNPFLSWEQMKIRVLEQFSPAQDTSAGERVLCLRQKDTVRNYRRDFIALASNAPEIPYPILEMAFLNGLRPKIKVGVKLMSLRGLQRVMDVAKLVEDWSEGGDATEETSEEKDKTSRSVNGRPQAQNNKPAQQSGNGSSPNKNKAGSGSTTSQNNTTTKPNHNRLKPPFRRLTPAEVAKWKAEGLCYRCDEKYVYPHRCSQA